MGSNSNGISDVAARFSAAIGGEDSDSDLAEIFADTVTVWHQYADAMTVPGGLVAEMLPKEAQALLQAIPDARQEEVRILVSDGAFVLSRITVGTVNGAECRSPVCSVVTVVDGRISRIDAYSDREQEAALRSALMEEFQPE